MDDEGLIRLMFFVATLAVLAAGEELAPRLGRPALRRLRWPGNLGLVAVSTLAIRGVVGLLPVGLPVGLAVGLAVWAAEQGWGLGNVPGLLPGLLPGWLFGVLAIGLLDLGIYWQHVASHRLLWFWRLHRVHHADTVLDLTTAVRFHPLEMLLSLFYKLLLVLALGPPAWAVLVFEVLLSSLPLFNHANLRLPLGLDRALRLFLVTPDMHRVHHSNRLREADSNYGFCFPWWDRLFRSYRDQPAAGHEAMTIGLNIFRDPAEAGLWRLLRMPFV